MRQQIGIDMHSEDSLESSGVRRNTIGTSGIGLEKPELTPEFSSYRVHVKYDCWIAIRDDWNLVTNLPVRVDEDVYCKEARDALLLVRKD